MKTKTGKTLIPRLRFPEFQNNGEWEVKRIGEFLTESKIPSYTNDPRKRITVRLNYGGVEKREYRGTEAVDASNYFIRKKGQFIYGKQNFHKGAFGIIPDGLDGFESSQDLPAFDFAQFINPIFFINTLLRNEFYKAFETYTIGTGSKRLHPSELFKVKIPLPSLPEQQKIADCLSSLDEVIAGERQKLELLNAHKKGLLQNLFPREGETVPKFRFPEFKDSGEWEYNYGNELFEQIVNKKHNSNLPILAITQEYGAVPREMIDYFISVTDKSIQSYKVVEIGDFIISLRSFQGGIEFSRYKGLCSPAYIILRNKVDLVKDFYRHYFKTPRFIKDLNKNIEGIRDGKMVSYKQFSEILIPYPSLPEQQKIASCLSSLDDLIQSQEQKIEWLEQHKKGLLQGLFPNVNDVDNG